MWECVSMHACSWYYVQISDGITQFVMWYMSWYSALSAVACGVSRVEWLWSFQQTERQASLDQAGEGRAQRPAVLMAAPCQIGRVHLIQINHHYRGVGVEGWGVALAVRRKKGAFICAQDLCKLIHHASYVTLPPLHTSPTSLFSLSSLLLLQSNAFQLCHLLGGDDTLPLLLCLKTTWNLHCSYVTWLELQI